MTFPYRDVTAAKLLLLGAVLIFLPGCLIQLPDGFTTFLPQAKAPPAAIVTKEKEPGAARTSGAALAVEAASKGAPVTTAAALPATAQVASEERRPPAALPNLKQPEPQRDPVQVEQKPVQNQGFETLAKPAGPVISPPVAKAPRSLADSGSPLFSYGNAYLTEDTSWHGEVVVSGTVTVAPQATLFIAAGTIVRFGGTDQLSPSALLIQGRISANGTGSEPVRFTSRFSEPAAGDWRGVILLGSEKKNLLEHCRLEWAETGIELAFSRAELLDTTVSGAVTGIKLYDSLLDMKGGGAESSGTGLHAVESEVNASAPAFRNNGIGIVFGKSSVYLGGAELTGSRSEGMRGDDSRVRISGGRFSANGSGLILRSSHGSVTGSFIGDNRRNGLTLSHSRFRIYGNSIVRNGSDGIAVENGGGVAWENALWANRGCDISNRGGDEFNAVGNWWGNSDPAMVAARICEEKATDRPGRIIYLPLLPVKPASLP